MSAASQTRAAALVLDILRESRPALRYRCTEWVQQNLNLSLDQVSAADGMLRLEPYQVEPIDALDSEGVHRVTVVGVEQTGKSVVWISYLLFRLACDPCPAGIVYQSDTDAADTNRDRVLPLMQGVPKLARELAVPRSKRVDAFHFSDAAVYFSGAGSPITSKPFAVAIADEPDFWTAIAADDSGAKGGQRAVGNLLNLEKRTRTYRRVRKLISVCSPTLPSGPIWREFLQSSMGWWCLRCLKCGAALRSADVHNLQWECDDDDNPKPDTIRLVCPHCGREHRECEAQEMNDRGEFIHEHEERGDHRGYQWGALACPRAIGWLEIAMRQMRAGKSGSREDQTYFDNSMRGVPFHARKIEESSLDALREHIAPDPDPGILRAVLLGADTQDNGWYAVLRGVDDSGNLYLLRAEFVRTLDDLGALYDWRYADRIRPMAGIIDEGGHRAHEVQAFAHSRPGLYTYKGDTQATRGASWTPSKDAKNKRLILANPYHYQDDLLWRVHERKDRSAGRYWYLHRDVSDEYLQHIAAFKPNNRARFGHEFRNWTSGGEPDHFFDAEKMLLVLLDVALKRVPAQFWAGGRMPAYHVEQLKRESEMRKSRGRRKASVPIGGV